MDSRCFGAGVLQVHPQVKDCDGEQGEGGRAGEEEHDELAMDGDGGCAKVARDDAEELERAVSGEEDACGGDDEGERADSAAPAIRA